MLKTYFVGLSFLLMVADVRCEPDYTFNFEADGWLKLHMTPETWEEAFIKCHNDGVPLTEMEIRWGSRGDGADTGDCLTMTVDGRAYYWSCKDSLPFICYRKLENQTMNECGTFDDEYQLNQQTGSCYKVHREKLTWTDAYGICASEGGYLVILNDEQEARFVKGMFPALTKDSNIFDPLHIGLRAWGKGRIWTTIKGERITDVYNNWYPGQPDNSHGKQDRGACLRDGYLDDLDSAETSGIFACEKSPKSKRFDIPPCTETLRRLCNVCDESQLSAN